MHKTKRKSRAMTSCQSVIAATLFVGFFLLWVIWIAVGEATVIWLKSVNDLPSWVQAFGSIAAIFGAAAIALWQRHIFDINEKNRRKELANVTGREVLSIVQEQILILEKLDRVFLKAKDLGSIEKINTKFIYWCIEVIPDYQFEHLKDLIGIGENCASALAQARGSIRQIRTISGSGSGGQVFSLPAVITFLIPSIKTGLSCLYIGRQELHAFLGIDPAVAPMYEFEKGVERQKAD